MTERSNASGLARYWPVLAAVAVVAAVLGTVSVLRGGTQTAAGVGEGNGAAPSAADGRAPALAAFGNEDPLAAPDCDRSTGRLELPTVYAPNCLPKWPAGRDNGGATAPGVAKDTITVAVYVPQANATATALTEEATGSAALPVEETDANREKVLEAYNALYETYGRKVKLVKLQASGANADDAAAKADAIKAATELNAFAVINGPTQTNAFADELVARRVLCLCTASQPKESYDRWAPYVWPAQMSSTQAYMHRADFLKTLAGKPAEFAGDALKGTTRKLGLVYYETADNAYRSGVDFFGDELGRRGVQLPVKIPYVLDLAKAAEDSRTVIARLKDQGVTSVIFAGDPFMPRYLTTEATAQSYFPEWIVTGSTGTDSASFARLYDKQQWRHAFGVTLLLARLEPEYVQQEGNLVSWHLGEELTSYPDIFSIGRLFTGIHLAGPDLKAETFRDGLFAFTPVKGLRTQWGSSYGNHGIWPWTDIPSTDDVALVWWDVDARGPNESNAEGQGMYRYVNEGQRYLPGELEKASFKMFDQSGTSLLLKERPMGDRTPDYPRRPGRG